MKGKRGCFIQLWLIKGKKVRKCVINVLRVPNAEKRGLIEADAINMKKLMIILAVNGCWLIVVWSVLMEKNLVCQKKNLEKLRIATIAEN